MKIVIDFTKFGDNDFLANILQYLTDLNGSQFAECQPDKVISEKISNFNYTCITNGLWVRAEASNGLQMFKTEDFYLFRFVNDCGITTDWARINYVEVGK